MEILIEILITILAFAAFIWGAVCLWRIAKAIQKQKSGKGLYKQWALAYATMIAARIAFEMAQQWDCGWQSALITGIVRSVWLALVLGLPILGLWRQEKKQAQEDGEAADEAAQKLEK